MLYITMEVEPQIVKQYKCSHCCTCKKYWGNGAEGGKKWLHHFLADLKIMSLLKKKKKRFGGILQHKQQVIAYCQTQPDSRPPKMPLKLAVQNLQVHCLPLWRKYAQEVKAAKGLSTDGQKSRELTALPEPPKSSLPFMWLRFHCTMKLTCLKTQEDHYEFSKLGNLRWVYRDFIPSWLITWLMGLCR